MSFKHGFRAGSRGPAFASHAPEAAQKAGVRQLVTFHLDGEEFAVEILKVQEIIRKIDSTRVPNAPSFVEGVINLRGKVVPVICLRKRFGLADPETGGSALRRIVVVEVGGTVAGLAVDSVSEVLRIPEDTVEPPPKLVKVDRDYVSGVGKLQDRLLILLDVDKILSDAERAACDAMAAADARAAA
jgi:purine-binding chemotaxis protein CheW